jgi:hypothetical protein
VTFLLLGFPQALERFRADVVEKYAAMKIEQLKSSALEIQEKWSVEREAWFCLALHLYFVLGDSCCFLINIKSSNFCKGLIEQLKGGGPDADRTGEQRRRAAGGLYLLSVICFFCTCCFCCSYE